MSAFTPALPDNAALFETTVERAYAPGRFGQMHYRRCGPRRPGKPALLCFHPSPMSSLVFDDFLPHMGRDRDCIAVDTPGYGLSNPPPSPPSIVDYASAMGELIDHLDLPRVDLFGYHTGCAIAVELARMRPHTVGRILLNSALTFTAEELSQYRAMFARRAAKTLDEQILEGPERWRSWRMFWRDVPDETRAWALFCESERNVTRSTWGFNAVFGYDFAETLAATDKPLLIFNPEDDLHEITPRAAPLLRNGRIHALPGWTHGFLNRHPETIAELARDFLDD